MEGFKSDKPDTIPKTKLALMDDKQEELLEDPSCSLASIIMSGASRQAFINADSNICDMLTVDMTEPRHSS